MRRTFSKYAASALVAAMLCWARLAPAQAPLPTQNSVTPFGFTGVVQAATLDNAADPFSGGTLNVNGHIVTVPKNTVVQYPAPNSTWRDVFLQAPAPYGPTMSGLALSDFAIYPNVAGATYEVNVVGNRVVVASHGISGAPGYVAGSDRFIAGLITFSQEALNAGAGYINFIDYSNGDIWVGGTTGTKTGARVKINDAAGRYGRVDSPDSRFASDSDNPTIRSVSGYPMGVPRTDPAISDDPQCPQRNRPLSGVSPPLAPGGLDFVSPTNFTMPSVPNVVAPNPATGKIGSPDPRLQAPFEIGDWVDYAGTLVADVKGKFISAHTIINNVAIYTTPGTNPAYVAIDVSLMGTGGITVAGITEAATRTVFEGFSTDIGRNVYLFGIDLDPLSAAQSDRDWGSIDTDQGAPTGAAKGRWRFRANKLSVNPGGTGALTLPSAGNFGAPAREVRAVIASGYNAATKTLVNSAWQFDTTPGSSTFGQPITYANGIIAGQYRSPIGEYLFPEQTPGNPLPPNNFEAFQFLAQGGQVDAYDTAASPRRVGQLSPWPGAITPALITPGAQVNAGPNQVAASGRLVTLSGAASDPTGVNVAPAPLGWSQTGGPAVVLGLSAVGGTATARTVVTTFIAPVLAANAPPVTLTFTFKATNASGLPSATSVTITVNAVAADLVNITAVDQRVSKGRLDVTANATPPIVNGNQIYAVGSETLTCYFYDAVKGTLLGATPMTYQPATLDYFCSLVGTGANATKLVVNSDQGGSLTLINTTAKTVGVWKVR